MRDWHCDQRYTSVGRPQLRGFPQDVMEACYKAAIDIYADLSQNERPLQEVVRQPRRVSRRFSLGLQVAELSFDSFMMRMRTRA
jgi:TRAP-type mannitol/chloroaromatic compound transport system substrate-binding protein